MMDSTIDTITAGLNDVYFGRGDRFVYGGIEFTKCGFRFAGILREFRVDSINVVRLDGAIRIEFHNSTILAIEILDPLN